MAIDVTSARGLTSGGNSFFRGSGANRVGGINITKKSREIMGNPEAYLDNIGATVSDNVPMMDPNDPTLTRPGVDYGDNDQFNITATTGTASTANMPDMPNSATGYTSASQYQNLQDSGTQMTAATADPTTNNLVNTDELQIDMDAAENNSAYSDFASQNISTVIDTTTIAGKMAADNLGQFNYTDAKQTVQGQLGILMKDFVDGEGNPKIPAYASGLANSLKATLNIRTQDMGPAMTEKLGLAIMQSMLPIAQQDAQIFNSIAMKGLDNKQQSIINRSLILSKFEGANLEAKVTGAVQNAKTFTQFDMTNISNTQQARMVNTQARFQALFDDVKETNLARRFDITNTLDRDKWFTSLSANVDMYNTGQLQAMELANMNAENAAEQFNAQLEVGMFKYENDHQFQIDADNIAFRRAIETTNTQMKFQAAQFDAKNILGITSEQHNRIWNRADMQFGYLSKAIESQKDRDLKMMQMKMEMQIAAMKAKAQKKSALMSSIGSVVGSVAGGMFGTGGMFGASALAGGGAAAGAGAAAAGGGFMSSVASFLPMIFSDQDLKENIRQLGTHKCGLPVYKWEWNSEAVKLGVSNQSNIGVMAQEVKEKFPDAVYLHPTGYLAVNYGRLNR